MFSEKDIENPEIFVKIVFAEVCISIIMILFLFYIACFTTIGKDPTRIQTGKEIIWELTHPKCDECFVGSIKR